ncbi:plasmid pRiA4b ORF-3 family protein [Opitutus terrae]|uniref:Plasmid pRiA4b ORF-3 family protein n=1 Tax=Opitutus terrae (strain DSM 11246 / JCM 15787 / PB90-1) TaxID=452637 RepID=B1ZY05_OPITP|nr:plasmid pRiA4b ORF-3 family protein [Opitutus terrae]ACB75204.1 plasmid pRiA4b ORF-3 family protein [Opitutus terrae PB90-1]
MIGLHEGQGATQRQAERVFVLRLSVVGTIPAVWRRLVVRESMWLSRLHDSIQVAFDWFDYQTHAFNVENLRFGNPLKREELSIEDDRDVTLADLDLEHHERFTYGYHFSEGWQVEIHVEKIEPPQKNVHYPVCIAGERAGPPEDCGGLEAFHDMLACIKEPDTELGREWVEWLGPDYNPDLCDLDKINKALRKLGK